MAYCKAKIIIKNNTGLHARPCSIFVKAANLFKSNIKVTKNGDSVNGKSILGLMTLAASFGEKITVEADGPDAQDAINALKKVAINEFEN